MRDGQSHRFYVAFRLQLLLFYGCPPVATTEYIASGHYII